MSPVDTVVARDGELILTATVKNNTKQTGNVRFGTRVTLPNGATSGWLKTTSPFSLGAGDESLPIEILQAIPSSVPLGGPYTYRGFVWVEGYGLLGECAFEFQVGCRNNADYPFDKYCKKAEGDCEEGLGTCAPIPPLHRCRYMTDPVCGCNGVTYANACWAARARVSIRCEGECPYPVPD